MDTATFHHKIDKIVKSKPVVIYSELPLIMYVAVLVGVCYVEVVCWAHWGRVTVR